MRRVVFLGMMLASISLGSAQARASCEQGSTALFANLLGFHCSARGVYVSRQSVAARPPQFAPPAEILSIVEKVAPRIGAEINLVMAVIAAKSAYNIQAVSPRNAKGLMQLMPQTAARFGVDDPFNAEDNIRGGTTYLQWLLTQFAGNLDLALAAYNAGEGAVLAHGAIPPYEETIQYVARVKRFYDFYRRTYRY